MLQNTLLVRLHHRRKTGVDTRMTEREACRAALREAGLEEQAVSFVSCRTSEAFGRRLYDVVFNGGGLRWEASVDRDTGEVAGLNTEPEEL